MTLDIVKNYWNQWNDRERVLVVIASVICVLYIFYALLYAPLTAAVTRATVQLTEDKSTLQWMLEVRQQHQRSQVPQTVGNGQLLSILGSQLNKVSFHSYTYQLEQTSSGDIQLTFDEVPYNGFVVWLKKLGEQYSLTIKQLALDQTKTPGVVRALVVISAN